MLEVKDLKKVYRPKKGMPVKALDGVSLTFPDRGLVFVLGKSGSGKSTLLHVMGGLDTADSGEIIIKGKSSENFSQGDFDSYRNTYVGFIFQEYNVLDEFTVAANIGLALELQGLKATDERVGQLLAEVGLQGLGDRKPNELSGGQKQRVAIARALIKNPEIIMADEPTGALDSNTGKQVFDTLKRLSETRLVIVVSHDREFAEQFGDRVIELADGKVIGDITKSLAEEGTDADVCVVNDKFIRIRQGKLLTEKDLRMINEYLKGKKTDTVIPIEPKAEAETKKLLRIEDGGRSEVFVDTTPELARGESKGGQDFKLIKSRLPFKNALKMGASGLKHKRVRLAFSIILAAFAFSLFGFADTAAAYDKYAVTYQSMSDVGVNYLALSKRDDFENGYRNMQMSTADVEALREEFEIPFQPVLDQRFSLELQKYGQSVYANQFAGVTPITQELLDGAGFALDGELPASGEVVVTDWIFQSYREYGYRFYDMQTGNEITKEIRTHDDLKGLNLRLNERYFKISGILDTGLNLDKYRELFGKDINVIWNDRALSNLYQEFSSITQNGYHGLLFIHEGDEGLLKNSVIDGRFTFIDDSFETDIGLLFEFSPSLGEYSFLREGATELADDEIAVSADIFYQYSSEREQYIYDYAEKNWDESLEEYRIYSFYDYINILSYRGDGWYETAPVGKSGKELDLEFYSDLCAGKDFKLKGAVYGKYGEEEFELTARVGAIALYGAKAMAAVSPKIFSQFAVEGTYSMAIAPNTVSGDTVKALIRESYVDEGEHYVLNNVVMNTLSWLNDTIEIMADVFVYVGLAFAVFAGLLFMNFISTSIAFKRREIGILRAVGARSKDVFMIFFYESLIVALIDFVLATALAAILIPILNNSIQSGLNLTLLIFGIRQVGLVLGISVLVAFLASFFPVMHVARKKPIEAIRNK